MTSGDVDAIKVAKLLLEKISISDDCVPIIDEMHLQKSVQYQKKDKKNYKKDIHIATHLFFRKQQTNVSLALPVFDETTSAAIKSYHCTRNKVFHQGFLQ